LAVGVAHGLVQVRSPAPPLIAPVGLSGMVWGEQAVDVAKTNLCGLSQISTGHLPDARELGWRRASYVNNNETIIPLTDPD
jgi:XapX domain-containing protein